MGEPTIVSRTISAATDKAISLTNGAFARRINIPSGWSTIRVGLRLHMGFISGALAGTPRFAFGVCKGVSNIMGSPSTDHFAGFITTEANWGNQTGFFGGNACAPAKKVGTTLTVGSNFASTCVLPSGASSSTADRVLFFIDITKGSPNYSFRAFIQTSGTIADVSAATFLTQMSTVTPSLGNHTYVAAQTVAVDEATNGTFDAINVSWDLSTVQIEICDVAFAQIA